jgi:hypothetical protein
MSSPRRKSWSRPLADLVAATIDPIVAKQGFGEAALILNWPDIVGARLAAHTQPLALQWQRRTDKAGTRRQEPATLVLRVESAFALDLQHSTELVIERVNAHLGWRCVGRVVLKQGPIARAPERPRRGAAPSAHAIDVAERACAGIAEDGLRMALARLGAQIAESAAKG